MAIYIFFFLILPLTSSAFTLKLIHRDSPLSPLYQPNLSDFQRFSRNAEITRSRTLYLRHQTEEKAKQKAPPKQKTPPKQKAPLRLPARIHEPIFTAEIGIGTPSSKKTLLFDTGSGLTWTQCRPCTSCFRQNDPLFEPKRSTSYKILDSSHPLSGSFTCTPSGCTYYVAYYSGQYTSGITAVDTFTFPSTPRSPATAVPNLVFGCGNNNVGTLIPAISGILGMDRTQVSLIQQIDGLSKGRFSYCLPNTTVPSYVRFGDEARIKGWWPKKTPFANKNTKFYRLSFLDLSFNGRRLKLGADAFSDGAIIDSGSSVSLLNSKAYSAVANVVSKYFSTFKDVKRYTGERAASKNFMCYSVPAGFKRFPSMTFHLKGADFSVPSWNLFFSVPGNVFCMAMMETKEMTILGAFQQRNVRVVYNLKDNTLSFATEDCSKDARSK